MWELAYRKRILLSSFLQDATSSSVRLPQFQPPLQPILNLIYQPLGPWYTSQWFGHANMWQWVRHIEFCVCVLHLAIEMPCDRTCAKLCQPLLFPEKTLIAWRGGIHAWELAFYTQHLIELLFGSVIPMWFVTDCWLYKLTPMRDLRIIREHLVFYFKFNVRN